MQKRTALTVIELLVVLATCAAIATALAITHEQAFGNSMRTKCAKNLRSLGQAQYIYAQDDPQTFVAYGGPRMQNDGAMRIFDKKSRREKPDIDGVPSPTVDLWMLLRSPDNREFNILSPATFICPATKDTPDPAKDVSNYYDFAASSHLSYAYQYQHDPDFATLGPSSHPLHPLMADGNPYIRGKIKTDVIEDRKSDTRGNSTNHGHKKRPGRTSCFWTAT